MMLAATLAPDPEFTKQGLALVEKIRATYYLPESKLYADKLDTEQPAFNWGVGVWLTTLNSAARADKKYDAVLREFADATWVYWNDKGPVPGYDVLPGPKPVDRYYDDNEWMVMGMVDTYEKLGDRKYLDWAKMSLTYALSGEDEKLGGGIYWRESDRGDSKNTCSNAPGVAAALAVWEHSRDGRLLAKAREIYGWTYRTLRDPDDSLMWDAIKHDGRIDKTKWSYNTALMIRSAAHLYKATGRNVYRRQALEFEEAAMKRWFDPQTGAIRDGGRFAHLLAESFQYRQKFAPTSDRRAVDGVKRALAWLEANGKDEKGWYSTEWYKPQFRKDPELIDQASVARGLLKFGRD